MVGPRKAVLLTALVLGLVDPSPMFAQPSPQAPAQKPEAMGEEVMLTAKTLIYKKGAGVWDTAYETLLDAFKAVYGAIEKEGLKADGPAMTIITEFDGTNFRFQAGVPIAAEPAAFSQGDIAIGKSPEGKAFKFVHRGGYNKSMDPLFTTIADFLDEKKLEAKEFYVEEIVTDVLATPPDKLVIHIFMPVK